MADIPRIPPAPRRFRYSLRALLIWILAISVLLAAGRWVYVRTWLQARVVAKLEALGVTPEYSGIYTPSTRGGRFVNWQRSYITTGRVVVGVKINVPFPNEQDAAKVNHLLRKLPHLVDATAEDVLARERNPEKADRHFATAIDGLPLAGVCVDFIEVNGGRTANFIRCTTTVRTVRFDGRVVPPPDEFEMICQAPHVQRLILENTSLTDDHLGVLASATQLEQLHLWGSYPYSKLVALGELPHCDLDLSPHGITDDEVATHIATLPNLTRLSLAFESPSDDAVAALAKCKRLKWLGLQDTTVTDKAIIPLADLPALEGLQLAGTNVTEEGLAHLSRCKSLRSLCIPPAADTARVRAALPQLEQTACGPHSSDAPLTRQRRIAEGEARRAAAREVMP